MSSLYTVLYTFCFLFLSFFSIEAAKKPTFSCQEEADNYLITHFNLGASHYNQQEWRKGSDEFEKVIYFFPSSTEAAEASYFLGICYFEMKEYDFANESFSNYIKTSQQPAFFEDAVYYKFCIAEHLKIGRKKRPFKNRYLPKLSCGKELALTIYDEVVTAMPNHEITIQALYSKAGLLRETREYRSAVDTYQTIIKRFPKDEIVPVCYVNIANTYIEQARLEFQNPDILALAELNSKKFAEDFPRDENVERVKASVFHIKELYAKGLSDIGSFYERIGEPAAAVIYYQSAIEEFPDTFVAKFCKSRLLVLLFDLKEEEQLAIQEGQLDEVEELEEQAERIGAAIEMVVEESCDSQNACYEQASVEQLQNQQEPYVEQMSNMQQESYMEPMPYVEPMVEQVCYIEQGFDYQQTNEDEYALPVDQECYYELQDGNDSTESSTQVDDLEAGTYIHYSLLKPSKR